jgi:hypothetical protein
VEALANMAYNRVMITPWKHKMNANFKIVETLLPEFLLFKPADKTINEMWFGPTWLDEETAKRKKLLEELLCMLKKQAPLIVG